MGVKKGGKDPKEQTCLGEKPGKKGNWQPETGQDRIWPYEKGEKMGQTKNEILGQWQEKKRKRIGIESGKTRTFTGTERQMESDSAASNSERLF